jgi:glycerophosphoryl diester phosphodiesterase
MILNIGHRGAKFYAPENTIRSFLEALKRGAEAIEFDVRKTKDKKLVVFHDKKVDKLTDKKGDIGEYTLKELSFLKVQKEPIPTLKDVLDFCLKQKNLKKILIELKVSGVEKMVLNEVKKRNLCEKIVLSSFFNLPLKTIKRIDSKVETGWVYIASSNPLRTALNLKADYLIPFYRVCTTRLVKDAHKNGIKVFVWTINTEKRARLFVKRGVDGIITDKPDVIKKVLNTNIQKS